MDICTLEDNFKIGFKSSLLAKVAYEQKNEAEYQPEEEQDGPPDQQINYLDSL